MAELDRYFLAQALKELSARSAQEIVAWAADRFGDRIAFATSLGLEDQVITDMIAKAAPGIPLFTLDTGRLFPETYDLLERTEERYGLRIKVCFPDAEEVARMVDRHGINLFRKSVELRKLCCRVRKVYPLKRRLEGLEARIAGLRSGQAESRKEVQPICWDEANGLYKICPLFNWMIKRLWQYIEENNVPYNPLHDRGYASVGCACCTRPIRPGEDIRAGRWWWERPEQRECGLHVAWKDSTEQQHGSP